MDSQEELAPLIYEAMDSVKTTVLTLEAAAPLLGQRHMMFQQEATRLIAALHRIEVDVIALLDADDVVDPDYEALMHVAMTEPVACAICGGTIQSHERSIPTTTGASVHFACADQQTAQAMIRRRRFAMLHGLAFVAAVIAIGLSVGITLWLLVFIVGGLALHAIMHRRWWYYLRRDVGTWLLLGGRR